MIEIECERKDFTIEQVKFCNTLESFASQIKDLSGRIRRDRKEIAHNHPITHYLAELENITTSFSEIYGGYWRDIDLYPSFYSFIEDNIKYLKGVLSPCIKKLKKAKIPKKGAPASGMNGQFLSYLKRVENVYNLLLSQLENEKKREVSHWWRNLNPV